MIAATVIIGLSFFNMLYFLCVLFCCSSCIFNINFFSLLILVFGFWWYFFPRKPTQTRPDITAKECFWCSLQKKNLKDGFERPSTFSLARRVFSRVSPMAVVGERRRRTWNVRSVGNGRDSFAQFSTSLLFISFYEQQKKKPPDTFFLFGLSQLVWGNHWLCTTQKRLWDSTGNLALSLGTETCRKSRGILAK